MLAATTARAQTWAEVPAPDAGSTAPFLGGLSAGWAFGPADGGEHGAGGWSPSRPDGHAPIGVMGEHRHVAGEWMVSVRAMRMHMDGLRDGTDSLSKGDVLAQGFPVTPTEMDTDMLMFGAMVAPNDRVTLTAMLPYLRRSMDHVTGMGGRFTTRTEGPGDVGLGALVGLADWDRQSLHLNLGVSLPTGSINERDDTAMAPGTDVKLPYPMQLGSGTFDLLPGATYQGQTDRWSWGAQALATVRLGENSEDYRLGNRGQLTGWGAWRWSEHLSSSLRLTASKWGSIAGADPELNPAVVPTANPGLQAGERIDLALGVNAWTGTGWLAGHRLAAEFGVPVYQDLDGPQLEMDWVLTLGWQVSF